MANVIRTVDQIVQDCISFIQSRQPNISTQVGSVVGDVVISGPAQEFENTYVELNRISQIQSLSNPDIMSIAEMDLFGNNFEMTRNPGTAAQTTETFRVVNLQTIEPNITIPVGTIVTTQQTTNTPSVGFITTTAGTFISSQASSYFNPLTGFYELTLPVIATTLGVAGNAPAGAIRVLSSNVARIFSVTNTVAATGGTDLESNEAYALRIQTKLAGNNLGTVNGLKSLALSNNSVLDVSVVGPNDSEMLRNEFGGSVDIYVLGAVSTPSIDTVIFDNLNSFTFILQQQPATATSGSIVVSGSVNGVVHIFTEAVDYILVADPTTLVNGSVQVQNGIKFLTTGTLPDNLTQVTISYTYNQLIATLQNIFNTDSQHIVASDILVKEAQVATIGITASIGVIPGFDTTDTLNAAQTALTIFLVTNKLGATFSQSQIVSTIEDTPGVNEVDLTTLVITKNTVPITTQVITVDKTEYLQVSTLNLVPIF